MKKAIAVLLFVATLAIAAGAQSKDNFAPASDDDLNALAAAAQKAKSASAQCKGNSPCLSFRCEDAAALNGSLDQTRAMLYDMNARIADTQQNVLTEAMMKLNYERQLNEADSQKNKEALAWSKFLSSSAKITLDIASLTDAASTLQDLYTKFSAKEIEQMTTADQWLNAAKVTDQMFELANGTIGYADDATAHLSVLGGDEPYKGFVAEDTARWATYKGAASDLLGAITDFREKYKEIAAPSKFDIKGIKGASPLKAGGLGSMKGVLSLTSKVLGMWAEQTQKRQEGIIQVNEEISRGLDTAHQNIYNDYLRLQKRQVALSQTLAAVRDAYQSVYACAAQCPGVLGPAPANKSIDPEYGRSLATGQSVGEALQNYNALVPQMTARIAQDSAKFKVTSQQAAMIHASPSTVDAGKQVTANYLLPKCDATDGTQVRLIHPDETADALANASQGQNASLGFDAPQDPGQYEVRLVSRNYEVYARDAFTVSKPSSDAAFNLSGTWSATYPGGPLKVTIVQSSTDLIATLVDGNTYVPAGQVTFKTSAPVSNTFSAQQTCAYPGFKDPRWINVNISVADNDHFVEALAAGESCGGFPVNWSRVDSGTGSTQTRPTSNLSGSWNCVSSGCESGASTISQDGSQLRLASPAGGTSTAQVSGDNAIVPPDGLRGTVSQDGNSISWSNGDQWARSSAPSTAGTQAPSNSVALPPPDFKPCAKNSAASGDTWPCLGPQNTTIYLVLRQVLNHSPIKMLFTRNMNYSTGGSVTVGLQGSGVTYRATAPATLCMGNSPHTYWVGFLDSAGKMFPAQGQFTITECP